MRGFVALLLALCVAKIAISEELSERSKRSASTVVQGFLRKDFIGRYLKDVKFKHGYVKNIEITDIDLPKINLNAYGSTLWIRVSGMGLSIKAKYRVKWSWVYRESGRVYASVKNVRFGIPISTRTLKANRSRCYDSIGKINFRFKGGLLGFLANLVKKPLLKSLKKNLKGDVCDIVAKAINKNGPKLLSTLG